jgi:hypothetical protein
MALKKIPYRDWDAMTHEAFSGADARSVLFENDAGDQAVVGPAEAFDGELLDVYVVDADMRCLVADMETAEDLVGKFLDG